MKTPTTNAGKTGFRFSASDAVILLLGCFATWRLRRAEFPLWWIVPIVIGHFFLFCNVFLVWRRWETVWAALFVINVASHIVFGALGWVQPLVIQLPVTLAVIVAQIRSPYYRGVFAKNTKACPCELSDG